MFEISYFCIWQNNRNLKFFKKNSIQAQFKAQNGLTFLIWTSGSRDICILVFQKGVFVGKS